MCRYVSREFVLSNLAKAEDMARDMSTGNPADAATITSFEKLRQQLLTLAFIIKEGWPADASDHVEYDDEKEDWVERVSKDKEWTRHVHKALDDPNLLVRGVLDKIWVHEGAGLNVLHDRVYIKTCLDRVLSEDTHVLIEEVHLVAPSTMLDPEVGGALVDTPGLGDPDVVRLGHTERAVNEASGLIVFSDVSLTAGAAKTKETLCDLGVITDLAIDKANNHTLGRPVAFVFNPEAKSMRAKAVPAGEPNSVLGGCGSDPDHDVVALQESYRTYTFLSFCDSTAYVKVMHDVASVSQYSEPNTMQLTVRAVTLRLPRCSCLYITCNVSSCQCFIVYSYT